jgi:hypothetical protein
MVGCGIGVTSTGLTGTVLNGFLITSAIEIIPTTIIR